jgi:hypothetical protein
VEGEVLLRAASKAGGMDGAEQLIRPDKSTTGFKGVCPNQGRYQAECDTPPCRNNNLSTFDPNPDADALATALAKLASVEAAMAEAVSTDASLPALRDDLLQLVSMLELPFEPEQQQRQQQQQQQQQQQLLRKSQEAPTPQASFEPTEQDVANGWVDGATRRPDGTWRKPVRVKEGWVGDLDKTRYESRGAKVCCLCSQRLRLGACAHSQARLNIQSPDACTLLLRLSCWSVPSIPLLLCYLAMLSRRLRQG